jgi:hypothetical protein
MKPNGIRVRHLNRLVGWVDPEFIRGKPNKISQLALGFAGRSPAQPNLRVSGDRHVS